MRILMLMFSMILVGNLHAANEGVVKKVVDIDKSISLRSYDESFYISNNSRNEQKDQIAKISKQTDVRYSNPEEPTSSTYKIKKGLLIKDNLTELAEILGYANLIIEGLPSECDWRVEHPYSITYTPESYKSEFTKLLKHWRFSNIRFFNNGVITAQYSGSLSSVQACIKGGDNS